MRGRSQTDTDTDTDTDTERERESSTAQTSMPRKPTRKSSACIPVTASLFIGDCKVEVPNSISFKQSKDLILLSSEHGNITISSCPSKRYHTRSDSNTDVFGQGSQGPKLLNGFSVELLNPKSLDAHGHEILKDVLKLYSTELPEMSFAANTGKESPFLERCVTSGKYCTLLLNRMNGLDTDNVIGAISYQILPPDTQYAEIPLAAVSKNYQRKGVGSFLFNELQRRLHDVGVLTLFCWGDQESENFWLKQGFLKVAEVDGHGRPRKLPIKPDVRRAMSIPGNATLLVSHLHGPSVSAPTSCIGFDTTPIQGKLSTKGLQEGAVQPFDFTASKVLKPSPAAAINTPTAVEVKPSLQATPVFALQNKVNSKSLGMKGMLPLNIDGVLSSVATQNKEVTEDVNKVPTEHTVSLSLAPGSPEKFQTESQPGFAGVSSPVRRIDANSVTLTPPGQEKENICIMLGQGGRKRGRPLAQQAQKPNKCKKVLNSSNDTAGCAVPQKVLVDLTGSLNALLAAPHTKPSTMVKAPQTVGEAQQDLPTDGALKGKYMIYLMNVADNNRRLQLTKFVERLGGAMTNDGNLCTHVVTGEARRTYNFCIALSAGAWVVSPAWLKASVKENKFIEEGPFVLEDEAFQQKYKTKVHEVVQRAKQKPHGLLEGKFIYLTRHVQPPIETITAIILSAGGKVLPSLGEANDLSSTLVIACEEDMSDALMAAKAGLPTYSSEWLMNCIMKQELDLTTTQFTESL